MSQARDRLLSRTLSHMLRHDPLAYGLALEAGGWVGVDAALRALRAHHPRFALVSQEDLERVVATLSRGRHEISGNRIRARYGHSVQGGPQDAPQEPPPVLYHGTSPEALESIRQQGLLPMGRVRVHLGVDREEAQRVGRRHTSDPVLLRVDAQRAYSAGVPFYLGSDRIWTAGAIPPRFIHLD